MIPRPVAPPVVVSVVVALAAGLGVLWLAGRGSPEPQPAPVTPPDVLPAPTPPVVQVDYTPPKHVGNPDPSSRRGLLRLPDGQYVSTLNGAVDVGRMEWPADRPYSPIVGRERDAKGLEWYVHADGSKSTTFMTYRAELGRMDAVTTVANPAPVGQIVDPQTGGGAAGEGKR